MIRNYYAYKNDKVGVFNDPFMIPNPKEDVKELVRVAALTGQVPAHAEELSLYFVGFMDDKTGVFNSKIDFICSLSEFVQNGK